MLFVVIKVLRLELFRLGCVVFYSRRLVVLVVVVVGLGRLVLVVKGGLCIVLLVLGIVLRGLVGV